MDYRYPFPKNKTVSKVMRSNKSKNNAMELVFRKALRTRGIKCYRLHWNVAGKPDVVFPGKQIAIFLNGCFWHRCPHCKLSLPKNNVEYWREKFRKNVERDKKNVKLLNDLGWKVFTFWECEIRKNVDEKVELVHKQLKFDF